jgi:hypothetical protein
LNDFKVVILNIVNQFPYVSVLLVLVSVSYNNQLINSASNCYIQTDWAIGEIRYLVIDSAKNVCVLFLPLELINCCCFYYCLQAGHCKTFIAEFDNFRMTAIMFFQYDARHRSFLYSLNSCFLVVFLRHKVLPSCLLLRIMANLNKKSKTIKGD